MIAFLLRKGTSTRDLCSTGIPSRSSFLRRSIRTYRRLKLSTSWMSPILLFQRWRAQLLRQRKWDHSQVVNKVIGEINARTYHFELLREARLLRIQLKELQEQMTRWGGGLQSSILKCCIRTFLPIQLRISQVVQEDE